MPAGAVTAAVVGPEWTGRTRITALAAAWLPFVDSPQHAAAVAASSLADDPRYGPCYAVDLAGAKYVLFHPRRSGARPARRHRGGSTFLSVHLGGARFLPMALALAAAIGPPRLDRPIARLVLGIILVRARRRRRRSSVTSVAPATSSPGSSGCSPPPSGADASSAWCSARAATWSRRRRTCTRRSTMPRSAAASRRSSFTSYPTSPVRTRAAVEPPLYPPHFEWFPDRTGDHATLGGWFDYVLVRERRGTGSAETLRRGVADPPREIARVGRSVLFAPARAGDTRATPVG